MSSNDPWWRKMFGGGKPSEPALSDEELKRRALAKLLDDRAAVERQVYDEVKAKLAAEQAKLPPKVPHATAMPGTLAQQQEEYAKALDRMKHLLRGSAGTPDPNDPTDPRNVNTYYGKMGAPPRPGMYVDIETDGSAALAISSHALASKTGLSTVEARALLGRLQQVIAGTKLSGAQQQIAERLALSIGAGATNMETVMATLDRLQNAMGVVKIADILAAEGPPVPAAELAAAHETFEAAAAVLEDDT